MVKRDACCALAGEHLKPSMRKNKARSRDEMKAIMRIEHEKLSEYHYESK